MSVGKRKLFSTNLVKKWFVIAIFILTTESGAWKWKKSVRYPVCVTPECQQRGREYLGNLDRSVKPCDNFYKFACGSWYKNHPGPPSLPEWNFVSLLYQETLQNLRKILDATSSQSSNRNYAQAKLVYDTCSAIPQLHRQSVNEIADHISRTGRYPFTTLWNIHNGYLKLTGESALFDYEIMAHAPSEGLPLLMVTELESPYGSIRHEGPWSAQEEKAYTGYLYLIMKILKLPDPENKLKETVKQVFEFRKELNQVIQRNVKFPSSGFFPMTPRELEEWYEENIADPTDNADIPWESVSEILLHSLPSTVIKQRKVAAIRRHTYIIELSELLCKTPEEVIANHMEMYFVEKHLEVSPNMFKMLQATTTEPRETAQYLKINIRDRWETCLMSHNMKKVLGTMLLEQAFPAQYIPLVHNLMQKIKAAVKGEMIKSPWLSPPVRSQTCARLDNLKEWIGGPPWYTNPSVPIGIDDYDITRPNAVLDLNQNAICVHASYLRSPIFDPRVPDVYNIAALGTTIGHEYHHIISDCGSYTKKNGAIGQVWWPLSMRKECIKRKRCFVDQYNTLTRRELRERFATVAEVNALMTFVEDYPDVMGLKASYKVFEEEISQDPNVCHILPGFQDYNCQQMFFIAFANTMCGYMNKASALLAVSRSHHSLASVRINGAVMNNEDFSNAFGCRPGSPMNPVHKCNLWK